MRNTHTQSIKCLLDPKKFLCHLKICHTSKSTVTLALSHEGELWLTFAAHERVDQQEVAQGRHDWPVVSPKVLLVLVLMQWERGKAFVLAGVALAQVASIQQVIDVVDENAEKRPPPPIDPATICVALHQYPQVSGVLQLKELLHNMHLHDHVLPEGRGKTSVAFLPDPQVVAMLQLKVPVQSVHLNMRIDFQWEVHRRMEGQLLHRWCTLHAGTKELSPPMALVGFQTVLQPSTSSCCWLQMNQTQEQQPAPLAGGCPSLTSPYPDGAGPELYIQRVGLMHCSALQTGNAHSQ